jgi:uncharacterized protein
MSADAFERTPQNTVKRIPDRGHYDKETIYQILDAAFLCHVAFVDEGKPFIIPTLYARDEDSILLHGATTSRMLKHAQTGQPLTIAVTHVDGLVLARSVFHHSINYRSAVIFGCGTLVADPAEKMRALELFTEKLLPGRWADARAPHANELKATSVIAVAMDAASAKIRAWGPKDDDEDMELPVWAGVLPVRPMFGEPIASDDLIAGIGVPDYIPAHVATQNHKA